MVLKLFDLIKNINNRTGMIENINIKYKKRTKRKNEKYKAKIKRRTEFWKEAGSCLRK